MPVDHSLDLRKALVKHLRDNDASPAVVALVGARVYGEQPPATPDWPFIRIGLPVVLPYEASGWDGSEHAVSISAFAKGPGTDRAAELAKEIERALSGDALPLVAPVGLVSADWVRTQIIPDGADPSSYHAIVDFNVRTAEE